MASLAKSIKAASQLDRLMLEGEHYAASGFFSGTLVTGSFANLSLPSLSRAFYIEQVEVSCNKQVDIQVNIGNAAGFTGIGQAHRLVLWPGVPAIIPIRALVRPTDCAAGSTTFGDVNVRTVIDGTPAGAIATVKATGYSIYDDHNLSADRVILWIGDSITNGTAGVTSKHKSYEWMLRDYFRGLGSNVRLINKSLSGTTSSDQERRRTHGLFGALPQVDLLVYSMGSNDATQSISAATHQANVAAMIVEKQKLFPLAKMIVFGSTPLENNTSEAALALIRTAGAAAVTAAADAKVLFCSLATAFDRTSSANYASSDVAGSRVHPSDAGHAQVDTAVRAFLAAQSITL